MRRLPFALLVAAPLLALAVAALRVERPALAADDDWPEVGATDTKSYLRRLKTSAGPSWVLQHEQRAFVVGAVLDDAVILCEIETHEGEPMEASDSIPAEDRIRAIWNHGKSEPSTFRKIATYMVPFHSIVRVSHRSLEGHERFTIRLVGLE